MLVTAERRREVVLCAIQTNLACAQSPGHSPRALHILRDHKAGQTILRVVGNTNRVLFIIVRNDHQHRSEDLLLRDGHVVAHIGKHRGARVVANGQVIRLAQAATYQSSAFVHSLGYISLHAIKLLLAYQRPHLHSLLERVTHYGGLCRGLGQTHHFVMQMLWHQHA